MNWLLTAINWYFYLFLLGAIFFPITKRIFSRFPYDSGYAFSKTIAILFFSYVTFVLGYLKILEFERSSLLLLILISVFVNYYLFKKVNNQKEIINWKNIILIELIFFGSFIFWTSIRGQESSIRGLEKFMDFGFINSILRSKYFPPLDIWYSGYPINYYYFGHLTGAVLIKLANITSNIGYNLILSTIFALGITQVFSLLANIVSIILKKTGSSLIIFTALLGSFIVNLGGNLHTIYLFTKGYPNDNPIPFWQILSSFNPTKYWYPNATRFIPFTIHEFPSYSYVVADLHGHVFDIPFVLLTIAILFLIFTQIPRLLTTHYSLPTTISLGFLTSIHYMTNAFDGPIYLFLIMIVFFIIYKISFRFIINTAILLFSFLFFSLPFSLNFSPFVSGIGINCSPEFLVNLKKLGPFLFEKGNCQATPFWMLFVLWGFFFISFILLMVIKKLKLAKIPVLNDLGRAQLASRPIVVEKRGIALFLPIDKFMIVLFSFGTLLIIIPIFFYIKDIYPAHYRANTMFKLGYQAFILMGVASGYVFFRIVSIENRKLKIGLKIIYSFFFFFIAIYPFFSIPSFYGNLRRPIELDGSKWLKSSYPADNEIINFLNNNIQGQPIILEAQGDSYTDYERISAYTGLPTVAGWWVHEWLWRGSPDVIGKRIPDVTNIYESKDLKLTKNLINKYQIKYVVISEFEKQKYKSLNESKFNNLGRLTFRSNDGKGAIYQVNY